METETKNIITTSVRVVWLLLVLVILSMWGCPKYNIYSEGSAGKAEHERAKQNRLIKVEEAKAENEAAISKAQAKIKMANAENEAAIIRAKGEAQAEIERAKGVAEANKIIGESLKSNKDYLHYLWIDAMKNGKNEKVYIPTEAGLPILEAK